MRAATEEQPQASNSAGRQAHRRLATCAAHTESRLLYCC